MSSNISSEDLRSVKTKKALCDAMHSLLKKNSFRKLTIKGICEEAYISRAAFYAHFVDKYDLLKHWMSDLWVRSFSGDLSYEHVENVINVGMSENIPVLKNLIFDADNETFVVLHSFIVSTMDLCADSKGDELSKDIVLSSFYAGGLITYLLWQIEHKFPPEVPAINKHLYELLTSLMHEIKNKTGDSN